MEDFILGMLWVLFEAFAEAFFEYVLLALADICLRSIKAIFSTTEIASPALAYFGYLLFGLATGGLSLLLFPRRLVHRSRAPGISLLIAPYIAGQLMWLTGSALRKQGKERTRIESFGYAATFAFGVAVMRFLFARPV